MGIKAAHGVAFLITFLLIGTVIADEGAPIPGELQCDIPGYDQLPILDNNDLPCGWQYFDDGSSLSDTTIKDPSSDYFGGAYIRVAAMAYWGAIGGKAWSALGPYSAASAFASWKKDRWISAGDTYAELTVQGKGEGHVLITDTIGAGHIFAEVILRSNMFKSPCTPEKQYKAVLEKAASSSSSASGSISISVGSAGATLTIPQTIETGKHVAKPFDWQVETHTCCTDIVTLNPSGTLDGRVFANASLATLVVGTSISLRYDIWSVLLLDCGCP